MLSRTIRRWCLYLGITAALAAAMIAVIGGATAQAATRGCLSGYLCLWKPNGEGVLVPSGQKSEFKEGVPVVEIDNSATNAWCDVIETPGSIIDFGSIGLGEEREVKEETTILSVSPTGGICPG